MFDLGDRVRVIATGREGEVIEFLRPGDRHPLRGHVVTETYSFVLFNFDKKEGGWFNDRVLVQSGEVPA